MWAALFMLGSWSVVYDWLRKVQPTHEGLRHLTGATGCFIGFSRPNQSQNAANLQSEMQSDLLWILNLFGLFLSKPCKGWPPLCSGRDFVEVVQDPKAGRDRKTWRSSLCSLSFQVSVLVEFVSCLYAIGRGDGKALMVMIW